MTTVRYAKDRRFRIAGRTIARGSQVDIRLKVSETYMGDDLVLSLRVIRAPRPGPVLFVTAAIHGDELNGTGIIHNLLFNPPFSLERGTLILVPVANVFGFESHERYLPDRRDLNRSFPGSAGGSLAARYAHNILTEIVGLADYGIDLHSAAFQRTNYPNVRADMSNPSVRLLARNFGCSLIVDGKGPVGSLRREACRIGVPTIILEAGEPWKVEPGVLALGVAGIVNSLIGLKMIDGTPTKPPYQTLVRKTTWLRARTGGMLKFHVSAGDFIEKDEPIATTYGILGDRADTVHAPLEGIVLGMTTMPAVKPGEPICHIAVPQTKLSTIRRSVHRSQPGLHSQVRKDLATNIDVVDYESKGG